VLVLVATKIDSNAVAIFEYIIFHLHTFELCLHDLRHANCFVSGVVVDGKTTEPELRKEELSSYWTHSLFSENTLAPMSLHSSTVRTFVNMNLR